MDSNRSRIGVLVGLAVAAGAFGAAAMMSAATAPTARADAYSDIVADVEADFAYGQTAFGQAATDFGSSDVTDGLQALLNGTNDYLVSVPDDLYIGTVDALTNEPVTPAIDFDNSAPANFSDAVSFAQADLVTGEQFFNTAAAAFSAADYADAAYDGAYGSFFAFDLAPEDLLVGAVDALGF